ncbi:MAG: hypothetical protein ACK4NR_11320 [Micavibrio sp.]
MEGNEYIQGPLNEYRYLPKKSFNTNILVSCYDDKLSICEQRKEESKVLIFKNAELSEFACGIAKLMWDILPEPKKSKTKQIFF